MKIAVTTCFHPMLADYLEAFKAQWPSDFRVFVREADFQEESEELVRNLMLEMHRDFDLVFTMDADEFLTSEDRARLIERMKRGRHDAGLTKVIDYANAELNQVYPEREGHFPVIALNPKVTHFYDGRCARFDKPLFAHDISIHHLGYTFSKEKMEWKNSRYWNKGDPKEIVKVMSRNPLPFEAPMEVKRWMSAELAA